MTNCPFESSKIMQNPDVEERRHITVFSFRF